MAIRIRINCPHCGAEEQVSPAAINAVAICGRCGRDFIARRDAQSARNLLPNGSVVGHDSRLALTVQPNRTPVPRPIQADIAPTEERAWDLRQIECLCGHTGRPFSSVFRSPAPGQRYRFWRNEYGSGSLWRAAYAHAPQAGLAVDTEPEEAEFPLREFEFAGWRCEWCGDDGLVFCRCGNGICRGEAQTITNGWRLHCPACDDVKNYTATAETLPGTGTRLSRPGERLPPRARPAPHLSEHQPTPLLAGVVRRLLKGR